MGKFKSKGNATRLSADYAFSLDSPNALPPGATSGSSENEYIIKSNQLCDMLLWFQSQPLFSVSFSPALTMEDRASIQVQAQAIRLETVSEGVGDQRRIVVFKRGHVGQTKAKRELTEEQRECSDALYRMTRSMEGYRQLSKDELSEILFGEGDVGQLRAELLAIWTCAKDEVNCNSLIQAITSGDLKALTSVIQEAKATASASGGSQRAIDLLGLGGKKGTGESPLNLCARTGASDALRVILSELSGIDIDAKDPWSGKNALTVSRTFEQCDVEAVLLQAGAHDPDAALFPLTSVAAALGLDVKDDDNDNDQEEMEEEEEEDLVI